MRKPVPNEDKPFALTRRYALVSLAGVLVAAVALAALYRDLSIRTIVEFGERNNVTVATLALNAVFPELNASLLAGKSAQGGEVSPAVLAELLGLIKQALQSTPVEQLKIYDENGIVRYSSREQDIGSDDSGNTRFQEAMHGAVRSHFRYRDVFNVFDSSHHDDNLIETYVPIQGAGNPRPIGVFELYTDVRPIVRAMTHNLLLVLLSIAAIMVILYSLLLYVVRRSERIISSQRQTIIQRNEILETLSARMLVSEESERRRLAWELHEEIAQTLSAAKVGVELFARTAAQQRTAESVVSSDEAVTLVQAAISNVRALAMDLRPPALDDFGIVATIRMLCREAEASRQLDVTPEIGVREEDVPERLKAVICRVVQHSLKSLVENSGISDIRVVLHKADQLLQLAIEFRAETGEMDDQAKPASLRDEWLITGVWERTVLSGGSFNTTRTETGRYLCEATWPVRRGDGPPEAPGTRR